MKNTSIKAGDKYGRLTAVKFHHKEKEIYYWLFRCDCGNNKVIANGNVKRGITKSCGCLRSELSSKRNATHRMINTSEYGIWGGIKNRCLNPKNKGYKSYGGRGIKICKRWNKFENFYKDMGKKPKGMSIDRINNDGDYKPSNCKWSTQKEQTNNTRRNIFISLNGVKISFNELSEFFGFNPKTLYDRVYRNNWDLKRALTKPVQYQPTSIFGIKKT